MGTYSLKITYYRCETESMVIRQQTSNILEDIMGKYNMTYQIVPPHIPRANITERAIQTVTHNFKVEISSLDPKLLLSEWDDIIKQAIMTLNPLCTYGINPKLSAHDFLFG